MNKARRTALLRASALSVAVAALAAACSSNSGSGTSSSSPSAGGSAVAASGSDLVIGTIGNFSGPSAQPEHLAGLQAWVDSVNAAGGIKGHQVKLVVEDDQGDATKSQADIRQLVQVDHVLAIVSPEASGTESGWASYVQQQHVAVIGGENDTAVWFTNPSFFPSGATVLTSLEMQAYAVKAAGKAAFGVVYCAEIAVCKQSVPALQGYAKAFHLTKPTSAAIAVAAPSYTAQCLALQQGQAQALVIDASYAAGSRFAPACAQQGYRPAYVIPSGAFDHRYVQLSQVDGAYLPTTNALWFAGTPPVNRFKQAMAQYEASTALGPNSISGWTGGVTGLIGPNGAGKTTLFNVASGLVRPAEGTLRLHGADMSGLDPAARARCGLGRTFQKMELFDSLTVRENVSLGREAAQADLRPWRHLTETKRDRRSRSEATDHALALAGITDLADRPVAALSTGQRRLVELGRCLAGQFDVLLLDEPSSGLDRAETEQFGAILTRVVAEQAAGILLVEHDMALVMSVCDYVHVLDFGTKIFEGTTADASSSAAVRAAYLGAEPVSPQHSEIAR